MYAPIPLFPELGQYRYFQFLVLANTDTYIIVFVIFKYIR